MTVTKQQVNRNYREHMVTMLEALGVKCNPATMSDDMMRKAIEDGKLAFLKRAQELEDAKR